MRAHECSTINTYDHLAGFYELDGVLGDEKHRAKKHELMEEFLASLRGDNVIDLGSGPGVDARCMQE